LAVERNVAASTQNQALNALLHFYRHALDRELGDVRQAVRAKQKKRLPVVLSESEVHRLLAKRNVLGVRSPLDGKTATVAPAGTGTFLSLRPAGLGDRRHVQSARGLGGPRWECVRYGACRCLRTAWSPGAFVASRISSGEFRNAP